MDIKQVCRHAYQERIALRTDLPTEFVRSLKTNERVPQFIDNLAKQLYRLPKDIKLETIKMAVYDMTDLFLNLQMRKVEEDHMSSVERHRIMQEEQTKSEMRAMADSLIGEENVTEEKPGTQTHHETVLIR